MRKKETGANDWFLSVIGEIIDELLPEFDDTPDLFGIDFDFA